MISSSAMKKAIPVKDIWEFAPHRPPMVWVDEVLDYSATGGETWLTLRPDGHYFGDGGYLRPTSCLEFIAQSYGFISVCHRQFSGDPVSQTPKRAFLASFNDAKFGSRELLKSVKPGDALRIQVSGARMMGPIVLFSGRVVRGADILCESRMKVFSE